MKFNDFWTAIRIGIVLAPVSVDARPIPAQKNPEEVPFKRSIKICKNTLRITQPKQLPDLWPSS
jgi:hypothetical protein